MTSILQTIADKKRELVAIAKQQMPVHAFAAPQLPIRDFVAALTNKEKPAIIAEIKKASPSKGIIREDFFVPEIARIYAEHGARCLSVLTDVEFFQGQDLYLMQAKTNCTLPILRKDFIIDEYQIHQSKALGADCILLIVALLDDRQLQDYCTLAQELGLAVLVESHTKDELLRAITLPTPLIGINNRDLHRFKTDLKLSLDLKTYVPKNKLIIAESGINTAEDIAMMREQGINTFLIGESLMRADDIGRALDNMLLP